MSKLLPDLIMRPKSKLWTIANFWIILIFQKVFWQIKLNLEQFSFLQRGLILQLSCQPNGCPIKTWNVKNKTERRGNLIKIGPFPASFWIYFPLLDQRYKTIHFVFYYHDGKEERWYSMFDDIRESPIPSENRMTSFLKKPGIRNPIARTECRCSTACATTMASIMGNLD